MAGSERLICASDAVLEGGDGVRFPIETAWGDRTGFVVRYRGQVRAYVNRCAHVPVELDWQPGKFFDDSGLYLICATHGALYDPAGGYCLAGPCRGGRLPQLEVVERDGNVFLIEQGE
ncbi:Rieske 2Fe-2S domain-containing protein [Niveibacterium umoris]|uniref:Nitrite reductase/ring-hydroxylating ferredoxin subunit n=1 Tax=Niveibacterium umoris TaxID=1193620 RepID=A0A840BFB2_9RHOO|nr:Rieske 2Fe-2S domain-containing protein [Niveibacterium umoris]MBB4010884.1 nitrite reductase/ring-hydroxylating ferredoxin subunit [Niveibacterium umoris]